jgi:hypothetical protein
MGRLQEKHASRSCPAGQKHDEVVKNKERSGQTVTRPLAERTVRRVCDRPM